MVKVRSYGPKLRVNGPKLRVTVQSYEQVTSCMPRPNIKSYAELRVNVTFGLWPTCPDLCGKNPKNIEIEHTSGLLPVGNQISVIYGTIPATILSGRPIYGLE